MVWKWVKCEAVQAVHINGSRESRIPASEVARLVSEAKIPTEHTE